MEPKKQDTENQANIREFYNTVYHRNATTDKTVSYHLRRLASKIDIHADQHILDVGCGTGEWLLSAYGRGAHPVGTDLSDKAIEICRKKMPNGKFYAGAAEQLPFDDNQFDVVSCLGSLEHFIDPQSALREMVRVAKADAVFLLLVPNSGFLTRRLGLFHGTDQIDAKEEVRTLEEWKDLFETSGLHVKQRWKDLHVLSWSWITAGHWSHVPARAAQALLLAVWPLSWQYQVYYLCQKQHV